MYFLDSCVCIDFMRGNLPQMYDLLKQSDPRLFKIPAIVEAELRVGAEKSANPNKTLALVDAFLLPFETVPFDSPCARTYATARASLEAQGQKIGSNDLLIAATALAHHATLVTQNVREFKRVGGLRLECWSEEPLE